MLIKIYSSPSEYLRALSMAYYGARHNTAAQMEKVSFMYCCEIFKHRLEARMQWSFSKLTGLF